MNDHLRTGSHPQWRPSGSVRSPRRPTTPPYLTRIARSLPSTDEMPGEFDDLMTHFHSLCVNVFGSVGLSVGGIVHWCCCHSLAKNQPPPRIVKPAFGSLTISILVFLASTTSGTSCLDSVLWIAVSIPGRSQKLAWQLRTLVYRKKMSMQAAIVPSTVSFGWLGC